MNEAELHRTLVWVMFGLGGLTFASLLWITAPYGRHYKGGFGPTIPSRVGWIAMESPAVLGFLAIFWMGAHRAQTVPLVFLAVWQVHYIHRTFIFPFRMRSQGKRMPAMVALMAIVFNLLNAYVNARWISHLGQYESTWLSDPRFAIGLLVFSAGLVINIWADSVLFRLRKPNETGYKIPKGGLYEFIASPNYFGEILEWTGYAIMTWALPGLSFAVYTFANLAPRAISNLRWYRKTFEDYPRSRRALIPFLF